MYFVIACRATDLRNQKNRRRNKLMRQGELEAVIVASEDKKNHVILSPASKLHSPDSGSFKYDNNYAAEVSSGVVHDCAAEVCSPKQHEHAAELSSARPQVSLHELATSH